MGPAPTGVWDGESLEARLIMRTLPHEHPVFNSYDTPGHWELHLFWQKWLLFFDKFTFGAGYSLDITYHLAIFRDKSITNSAYDLLSWWEC